MYHPKYKRFQLDILSMGSDPDLSLSSDKSHHPPSLNQSSSFHQDSSQNLSHLLKSKRKYQFVLNYGMDVGLMKKDSLALKELERQIREMNAEGEEEEIKQRERIHIDAESLQLLDIMQQQSKGEWIEWKCTSEDFLLIVRDL